MTHLFIGAGIDGNTVTFSEAELKHIKARRIRPGEAILAGVNDKIFICKMSYSLTSADIVSVKDAHERTVRICIATALPKGKRKHFLVEKLTEIGVAAIIPLETERSSFTPSDKQIERLRRIALEASKQSHGAPASIKNVMTLEELALAARNYDAKLLLDLTNGAAIAGAAEGKSSAVCAIGPEGGFTGGEIELLKARGFTAVSLHTNILRTETSCVYASAVLAEVLERGSDKQE